MHSRWNLPTTLLLRRTTRLGAPSPAPTRQARGPYAPTVVRSLVHAQESAGAKLAQRPLVLLFMNQVVLKNLTHSLHLCQDVFPWSKKTLQNVLQICRLRRGNNCKSVCRSLLQKIVDTNYTGGIRSSISRLDMSSILGNLPRYSNKDFRADARGSSCKMIIREEVKLFKLTSEVKYPTIRT